MSSISVDHLARGRQRGRSLTKRLCFNRILARYHFRAVMHDGQAN